MGQNGVYVIDISQVEVTKTPFTMRNIRMHYLTD
jgi:hypothetical protein